MKNLFLEDQGAAAGPYPLDQIHEFIRSGVVTADHLASASVEGPWKSLREFLEEPGTTPMDPVFAEEVPLDSDPGTFASRFLDGIVTFCISPVWKGDQTAQLYLSFQRFMCQIGGFSLLASGVIIFFVSGIFAAKTNSGYPFVFGVGYAVVMVLGHYLAVKFASDNRSLLYSDTVSLGSDSIPSSVAVLSLLTILASLLGTLAFFFSMAQSNLAGALALLLIFFLVAFSFYNIAILSRECGALLKVSSVPAQVSGGQLLLNIIKFFSRLFLATSLIVFGTMGCAAVLNLLLGAFFLAFSSQQQEISLYSLEANPFDFFSSGYVNLSLGIWLSTCTAWIPLASYLLYLLCVVFTDLLSAILQTAHNTGRIL